MVEAPQTTAVHAVLPLYHEEIERVVHSKEDIDLRRFVSLGEYRVCVCVCVCIGNVFTVHSLLARSSINCITLRSIVLFSPCANHQLLFHFKPYFFAVIKLLGCKQALRGSPCTQRIFTLVTKHAYVQKIEIYLFFIEILFIREEWDKLQYDKHQNQQQKLARNGLALFIKGI